MSEAIEAFNPDIIHVVSPGDVSEIGVYIAKRMKIPLAISWHTNLHEFGALRLARMLDWMDDTSRRDIATFSESTILSAMIAFYRLGDVLYAPNDELVEMLQQRTLKPVFLMKRGIDTQLFSPARRTVSDGVLRLGYVGRVTPEKNVRFLRELEIALRAAGAPTVRFLIVGDGSDREWLSHNLAAADLPGILRGEALAEAYANMDVFVFPSRTDTFGNVVLEAFASGRPAVVTDAGGPSSSCATESADSWPTATPSSSSELPALCATPRCGKRWARTPADRRWRNPGIPSSSRFTTAIASRYKGLPHGDRTQ